MKGSNRLLLGIILLLLLPGLALAEPAGTIPRAAGLYDADQFTRYSAYFRDEDSGKWTVHAFPADALMDQFWEYGENTAAALSVFHLELEGNAHTGVMTPVFRFYYLHGKKAINASAVSFLIDGVRYDLSCASTGKIKHGRLTAEVISAPLTQAAMGLPEALINGESISVRIIGEEIYTMELEKGVVSGRKAVQSASLDTLSADIQLFSDAGMNAYALWDLSAAVWEAEYGFSPAFASQPVSNVLCGESIPDAFGMLLPDTDGKAARAAQELLIRHGFLYGSAEPVFRESAIAAVRRAQQYCGLIVNGCMDETLAAALDQAFPSSEEAEDSRAMESIPADGKNEEALDSLGHSLRIALKRYWFAAGASAASGADLRPAASSDHILLIADGLILNTAAEPMYLFMQPKATVVYNDAYAYEAVLLCQRDNGERLDTMLLPLDQTRLILYAEIPAHLAAAPTGQWKIVISTDGETAEYSLE